MGFAKVGTEQFIILITGALIFIFVPSAIAVFWINKKKERLSTVLVGAAIFLLFAVILEKPLQNVLLFPVQMGLPEHALSRFISERPFLWALAVGLFPGVFEETGRFFAFRVLLSQRKNRETSVAYGIGHGGAEATLLLGIAYIVNIIYAVMINAGTFQIILDRVVAQAPEQAAQVLDTAAQLAAFSFADLGLAVAERASAFLFHIGASVAVFYACRDSEKFWLYPLAMITHTAMDGLVGLNMTHAVNLPVWALEIIMAIFGCTAFFGAFFLLYKKDKYAALAKDRNRNYY